MKKALIFENRIHDIVAIGAEFPVAPAMQWVDAPDDVSSSTYEVVGGTVVLKPPKPLSQVKATKLKQLETARKNAIATLPPVTVAGRQFPADSEYQSVISNLSRRLAAARPLPATVRGVDGVAVTLNAALLNQLDDALSAAVQAQWDKYWLKFEAVDAAVKANDRVAVEAVTW